VEKVLGGGKGGYNFKDSGVRDLGGRATHGRPRKFLLGHAGKKTLNQGGGTLGGPAVLMIFFIGKVKLGARREKKRKGYQRGGKKDQQAKTWPGKRVTGKVVPGPARGNKFSPQKMQKKKKKNPRGGGKCQKLKRVKRCARNRWGKLVPKEGPSSSSRPTLGRETRKKNPSGGKRVPSGEKG